ncbi:hypothetical protein M9H77_03353 [Catharanthus roseus]|uniref:Uncharacterized protein n=1 Tax=Catharanthus roseus TaxID=4058 RepID=A0ACC0CB67_CATRO|nr:hypothetical protein M9H77_03353 [Catharanthus roseus]
MGKNLAILLLNLLAIFSILTSNADACFSPFGVFCGIASSPPPPRFTGDFPFPFPTIINKTPPPAAANPFFHLPFNLPPLFGGRSPNSPPFKLPPVIPGLKTPPPPPSTLPKSPPAPIQIPRRAGNGGRK